MNKTISQIHDATTKGMYLVDCKDGSYAIQSSLRFQAAVAALPSAITLVGRQANQETVAAKLAIRYADALIKELITESTCSTALIHQPSVH